MVKDFFVKIWFDWSWSEY